MEVAVMGISVNGPGYQKQGSYTVNGSSQTDGVQKPDTKTTDAAQTAAVENDPVEEASSEAIQTAGEEALKYDEKLDQKERERIKQAVSSMNKHANGTEAIFGIHDKTNRVTIKIVDRDTKKVIKEIPPEKTLDMIAKVWELAGILVDEKK